MHTPNPICPPCNGHCTQGRSCTALQQRNGGQQVDQAALVISTPYSTPDTEPSDGWPDMVTVCLAYAAWFAMACAITGFALGLAYGLAKN